jgi:hypothetical protein
MEMYAYGLEHSARTVVDNIVSVVNQSATPMIRTVGCRAFILHDNRIYVFIRTWHPAFKDIRSPLTPNSAVDVAAVGGGAARAASASPSSTSTTTMSNVVSNSSSYSPSRARSEQQPLMTRPGAAASVSENANCSQEQDLILRILTTPKFRLYQTMYVVFRILDNTALLAIIVLSIMNGTLEEAYQGWGGQIVLVCAVGIEIFYDVMLNTNKFWALQRLSFWIGVLLFMVYFVVVLTMKHTGKYDNPEVYMLVLGILSFRFAAYLLEEAVDVAIDYCIHNTLVDAAQNRLASQTGENGLIISPDILYEGSFFAWSRKSVYKWIELQNARYRREGTAPAAVGPAKQSSKQDLTRPLLPYNTDDSEKAGDNSRPLIQADIELKYMADNCLILMFCVPAIITSAIGVVIGLLALSSALIILVLSSPFLSCCCLEASDGDSEGRCWCGLRLTHDCYMYSLEQCEEFRFLSHLWDHARSGLCSLCGRQTTPHTDVTTTLTSSNTRPAERAVASDAGNAV